MSNLDFIENSAKGYSFVWQNRAVIFYQAIPVLIVKILCIYLLIFGIGASNPLREGLFLFPASILEAFFFAHLIRFALFQEPIQFSPLGHQIYSPQNNNSRKLAIQVSALIYLLTKILLGLIIGLTATSLSFFEIQATAEPSLDKAILSMCLLGLMFWSIRLFWLFVPAAAGMPTTVFLYKIKGIANSIYFAGIFVLCFLPPIMLYSVFINILEHIFGTDNSALLILTTILQSCILIFSLSIQCISVAFGVETLSKDETKK